MKIIAIISKNAAFSKKIIPIWRNLTAIFIHTILMQKYTGSYNDYNLINTYIKLNDKCHIIVVCSNVSSLYSPYSFHYLSYNFGNTNFNKDS
jgi:hypothetical protein